MDGNPILGHYRSCMLYAGSWMLVILVQAVVVYSVSGLPFGYVLVDSVVFNALFASFLLALWYPVRFTRWEENRWSVNVTIHLSLMGMAIAVWLLLGYGLSYLMEWNRDTYLCFLNMSLWWKAFEGVLFYAVVMLIYFLHVYVERLNEKVADEIRLSKLTRDVETRIAVKDRQQIHIVPVVDIHFIEADGDYVKLHTAKSVYLKEKTMKYFEENLPARQFVRVHRSYIVNVNEVVRIELYEKESYRVHLRSGEVLRASSSGYKALKDAVSL